MLKKLEIGNLYRIIGDPVEVLYYVSNIEIGNKSILEMKRPINVLLELVNIEYSSRGYAKNIKYDADIFLHFIKNNIWVNG